MLAILSSFLAEGQQGSLKSYQGLQTTMRYHCTPIRMAISERRKRKKEKEGGRGSEGGKAKRRKEKCWWGCEEIRTLGQCCWECKMVQPLWETVWQSLKKLKIELPYDPVILLLGNYQKELKAGVQIGICLPVFLALFTIARKWKQHICLSTEE